MGVTWYKIWRDLAHNKARTLLVVLSISVGVFAMGIYQLDQNYVTHIIALALLGMSAFALYPIAITLACDGIESASIVSATQIMLFSYSVGSALGPVAAQYFMRQSLGLMGFFFVVLLATAIYMLFVSMKTKPSVIAE